MAVGHWYNLPLQTQVIHLHTHTHTSQTVVWNASISSRSSNSGWGALAMLRVLRPSAPAGRIPLGPCSNTAPSHLLVEHSQPPRRLLDSNKMTYTHRGIKRNVTTPVSPSVCTCVCVSHLGHLGAPAEVVRCCQACNPPSEDCNCFHLLLGRETIFFLAFPQFGGEKIQNETLI